MPASSWWAPTINPLGLSQGDLVADVLVGTTYSPITYLGRDTRKPKGYSTQWPERDKLEPFRTDDTGLYVARGKNVRVLVVSHSCEIEKKDDVRVLVAITAPLSAVQDPAKRAAIIEQKRRAFLPLPEVPGIGDLYADLRTIAYMERKLIPDASRQFSMTDEGVVRVRAQLIEYFTRLPVNNELADALATGLANGQ